MADDRSKSAQVRNPLLALPAAAEIAALPPAAKRALRKLCKNLQADARVRAEKAWRTHKAPMAVYWKALGVYAGHTARLCK